MELNEEGRQLARVGKSKEKLAKLQEVERALTRLLERPIYSNMFSALVVYGMLTNTSTLRRCRLIRLVNQAVRESEWREVIFEFNRLIESEANQYRQRRLKAVKKLFCKATLVAHNREVGNEKGLQR
jgi:mRNA degradation ribonuclease J1/J2